MVDILTRSYTWLIAVITALPPPFYYLVEFFFGAILVKAILYAIHNFAGGGD